MAKWGTGAGGMGPVLAAAVFLLFWTTGSEIGQPPAAEAQGYYSPFPSFRHGHSGRRYRVYRYERRHRSYRGRRYRHYRERRYRPYRRRRPPQRRSAPRRQQQQSTPPGKADWAPEESVKDPLQLVISLSEQRLTVYQGEREVVTSRVSTGRQGHATPTGVFSILQKRRHHRSNIYSRAPMPFMQRLTWSGIALHGSNSVPDRPASHGCVRLPPAFARRLFEFSERGVHVVITDKPAAPTESTHEALFQPEPEDSDAREAERALALRGNETDEEAEEEKRPDAPLRILITRRDGNERLKDIQRLLNLLRFDAGAVDGLMGPDTASAIRSFQKAQGLDKAELVSNELVRELYRRAGRGEPREGHIYVRRDMKPVFDAPVKIRDPGKPLGAHLFTAMHFEPGDREVQWLKVSLGGEAAEPRREARAETGVTATDAETSQPLLEAGSAERVLDRVKIPQAARERIEAMLTPGSSVAISDGGISEETTPEGTDFVVLTDE